MVEDYFGFSGAPFKLSPDSKFFFGSRSHTKAMAYLHYGLRQAEGFIVITGKIGAGKSMLIGHMLDQLNRSNVSAADLLTTNLEPKDLLSHILSAFEIEPAGEGRSAELEAFEDFLYDNVNRGRRVLLVVDEAQNLPVSTIEELRMLTNINHQGAPLFQVFLVGQPEFRDTLARSNMEQLRQRVIASYHLEALDAEETREYIEHRLAVVGRKQEPHFTEEAFGEIFQHTGGVPRRINTLCTRLLLFCALEKRDLINSAIVKSVAGELAGEMSGKAPSVDSVDAKKAESPAKKVMPNQSNEPEAHDNAGGQRLGKKNQDGLVLSGKPDEHRAEVTVSSQGNATLKDVRAAIDAISTTDDQQFDQSVPSDGAKNMHDSVEVEQLPPQSEATFNAKSVSDAPKSVMDQVLGLRQDLREAHKGNRAIHRELSDMEERQNGNVIQIENHISRATAILSDLKKK